jgi:hypothetical protein
MCAASVLASAALAAQGHRDAETLNGTAPASLFLLTVAESGERKSTADGFAMRGVRGFEADLRKDYDIERDLWRDAHEVWKATRAKILGDKKADSAAKRADLQALGPEQPAPQPAALPRPRGASYSCRTGAVSRRDRRSG